MARDTGECSGHSALCMPEVMAHLHVEPELRAVPAVVTEAHRHLRRHRPAAVEYAVEQLAADTEIAGCLTHGDSECRQNVFPEDFSGVNGCSFLPAHVRPAPSVIVDQINIDRLSVLPAKRNAPRTVDMNAVTLGTHSRQSVEIEAWNVHVLRSCCLRKSIEPPQYAHRKIGPDTAAVPRGKQVPQAGMPEVSYHAGELSTIG
jgi:hypothetical protein